MWAEGKGQRASLSPKRTSSDTIKVRTIHLNKSPPISFPSGTNLISHMIQTNHLSENPLHPLGIDEVTLSYDDRNGY